MEKFDFSEDDARDVAYNNGYEAGCKNLYGGDEDQVRSFITYPGNFSLCDLAHPNDFIIGYFEGYHHGGGYLRNTTYKKAIDNP